MESLHIRTKLCLPQEPNKTDFISVTRGATAVFTFDLTKIHISTRKIYSLEDILQLTFKFKQNKNKYLYQVIEYFKPTLDTVITEGKEYFNKIPDNSIFTKYKFKLATNLVIDDPILPDTLYEKIDSTFITSWSAENENWQINEKFAYYEHDIEDETGLHKAHLIELTLSPEDTLQFSPTVSLCPIKFEVDAVIDLDDNKVGAYDSLAGGDPEIVISQLPVLVKEKIL